MTTDRPSAIAATGLRKSYGDLTVLDGVDLHVAEGTVFALLGPNGAGKTTTLRILLGLLGKGGGKAAVLGMDPRRDGAALASAWELLLDDPDARARVAGAASRVMERHRGALRRTVERIVGVIG